MDRSACLDDGKDEANAIEEQMPILMRYSDTFSIRYLTGWHNNYNLRWCSNLPKSRLITDGMVFDSSRPIIFSAIR